MSQESKTRSVFANAAEITPIIDKNNGSTGDRKQQHRKIIAIWLFFMSSIVIIMILIGGLTRLTDSGLSITDWRPIMGAIPPLNDTDWQAIFLRYQQTSEFLLQNYNMNLAAFKSIYWWEWGHRFLGRMIGLIFAIPFLIFLIRKMIPTGWHKKLLFIGFLGALQGIIGWWMVKSGLSARVDVAPYRLGVHLILAFIILTILLWRGQLLLRPEWVLLQARRQRNGALLGFSGLVIGVLLIQIFLGALVAGLDAGKNYTDWPMMAGEIIPTEAFDNRPLWSNFFENPALTQFDHRLFAYLLIILGGVLWFKARKSAYQKLRRWVTIFTAAIVAQAVLGIITLMQVTPMVLAISHQLGAIVLMATAMRMMFEIAYPSGDNLGR